MEMKVDTDRIKELRRARAISQEELAGATELSLRTIQRIESEGIASLESKKALAGALGVSLEELDDTRAERDRFLRGLIGGTTLGMAGALIGGVSAYIGITSSLNSEQISAGEAGVAYGLVGAVVGLSCSLVAFAYSRLRRRAA
jgi:transcriptional regulator with XRE-family HTH domain